MSDIKLPLQQTRITQWAKRLSDFVMFYPFYKITDIFTIDFAGLNYRPAYTCPMFIHHKRALQEHPLQKLFPLF